MTTTPRPAAWAVLEQALLQRRPVHATYHGRSRLLCPHALGWKNGRAKVLAYQADSTTSTTSPVNTRQQWRSMFIEQIEDAVLTDDAWHTADNYTHDTNGIDELDLHIEPNG